MVEIVTITAPARASAGRRRASLGVMQAARRDATRLFLSDLFGYGLLSAAALALDWGSLLLLVKSGVNYLAAAATSFTAGMILAYVGSITVVFRGRRSHSRAAEAVGFFAIGFAGLMLNQALIFGFVHFGGLGVGLAKAPTVVVVFAFNFLARRKLLFAPDRREPA